MATAITTDAYLQQIHTARTQLHECFRRAHELLVRREAQLVKELETIQNNYEIEITSQQEELQGLEASKQDLKNNLRNNDTLNTALAAINKQIEQILSSDLSSDPARTIRFMWYIGLDRDLEHAGEIIITALPQPSNLSSVIPQPANLSPVKQRSVNLSPVMSRAANLISVKRSVNLSPVMSRAANLTSVKQRSVNLSPVMSRAIDLVPVFRKATNLSPAIRKAVNLAPVFPTDDNLTSVIHKDANLSPVIHKDANLSPVIHKDANLSPVIHKDANLTSVIHKDANLSPVIHKDANLSPVIHKDANLSPVIPKDANLSPIIPQPIPDYQNKSMPIISCCKHKKGTAPGELYYPNGLAIEPQTGRIYIADTSNHRVQVFTSNGDYSFLFSGNMNGPWGICINSDTVYVSQCMGNYVTSYQLDGTFINKVGSYGRIDGQFNSPRGLAVSPATGLLYVCDCSNHRVQIFGKELKLHSLFADNIVNFPNDIKLTQHLVIVLDRGNPCIHLFNSDKQSLLRSIISSGDNKQTSEPFFFTIDNELNFLLTDCAKHCVCVFNQSGDLIAQVGKKGNSVREFIGPAGIVIDNQNRIVVVSRNKTNALQLLY